MTMKRNLLLAAAFVLTAQMAQALTADELAAQYQAEGYGYIQIRTGVTQIKIEAVKDGQKVEVIYDAATGAILKQETETIGTIANPDAGPRLRVVDRDFVRTSDDDDSADDDGEDDDGRGRGRGRGGDDNSDDSSDDPDDSSDDSDDSSDDSDDSSDDDNDDDHSGHGGGDGGGHGGGHGGGDDGDDD